MGHRGNFAGSAMALAVLLGIAALVALWLFQGSLGVLDWALRQ